jgi:peptidoglycan/LPS O-acetylase OafA/YrhL
MRRAAARAAAPAPAAASPRDDHRLALADAPGPATIRTRFRCVSVAGLVPPRANVDHPVMDAQMKSTLALSFVGIGAVATGLLGIVLPPGERIAAGLALVVGAGIGVVVLAIGTQLVNDTPDDYASVFLVAAALGLAGTLVSLGLLWRRTADQRPTG